MTARTVPYRPSNGSEGECFMAQWCARCAKDAAFQADPENADGCQIIAATMALDEDDPNYPPEWVEDDVDYPADSNPRCTAFEALPDSGIDVIEDERQGALL